MIRQVLIAAILAVGAVAPGAALAETQKDVAGAFMAAAQTQDRKAALSLLADDVAIDFPAGVDLGRQGLAEGQAFVIGYLDGLFDTGRGLSVDSAAAEGDAVRFLAHKAGADDRYAIEVEVRGQQVVKLTVNLEDRTALAVIAPSS